MNFFKHYKNNKLLIKLASLNSLSVGLRVFSGFLTSKFIALFVGAEGLALVGNLRDFVSSTKAFSTLGIYRGIIKYVAEFKDNIEKLSKILSTALLLGTLSTAIISLSCFFFAEDISLIIFKQENNYAYVLRIFAIALPFYALNMFIIAVINGFSKYKTIIRFNILGQLLGAIVTLILIWRKNTDGALIAVAIVESILFLVTILGILKQRSLVPLIKKENFDFGFVKKLGAYSGMTLFSAIVIPLVAFLIRSYIIDNKGLQDAGLWEAMNRISKYYLMFVTTLISLYILPRFVEIKTRKGFRDEVFNFYKTIIPIFGIGLVFIYFLRNIIIQILLSEEFIPVENLFFWQLSGDFMKVLSFVIAYQFIAKKMFWHYIITETFSVVVLYFLSIYLIDIYGIEGANMAHFVNCILYFILILIVFSKSLFGKIKANNF